MLGAIKDCFSIIEKGLQRRQILGVSGDPRGWPSGIFNTFFSGIVPPQQVDELDESWPIHTRATFASPRPIRRVSNPARAIGWRGTRESIGFSGPLDENQSLHGSSFLSSLLRIDTIPPLHKSTPLGVWGTRSGRTQARRKSPDNGELPVERTDR